ncbi:MAG: transposase [Syntrophobacteraceae bacterium]|nr:transposase [Syntrophobacteraceae bacterium]
MAKSKYTEDFPQLVEMYLRQGMTEAQAAQRLGVSKSTFEQYKVQYSDFLDAIKKGKAPVDYEVENALLKRALGYTFTETKEVKERHDGGLEVVKERTETTKEVAPDVTAQIFWLKNRRPDRWRDSKAMEVTGKDGGPIEQQQKTTITAPEATEILNEFLGKL